MPRKSTRNANNTGSIRQRKDGTWEGRVVIRRDEGDGKQIRRSFYGKTQAEVRKKITAAQSSLDTNTYQDPCKISVAQWLDEWLSVFCSGKVKPLTLASYQGIINNHIKPNIGALQMQNIKGTHIQKFYNKLYTEGGKIAKRDADGKIVQSKGKTVYVSAPLSSKTVKNISAVLHKAFDMAVKQGYIQANPCTSTELPKSEKHEIKPFSDEDIPRFLEAIKGHPFENAWALCLFAGLREGECLGMSWKQVDFQKGRITINQQLQKEKKKGAKYYIAPFTKSNKPRTIEPPAIAFEYLKNEKRRQNENRLMFAAQWNNPDNLVFTNSLGECVKFATFYGHFKRIAASIGRPDARPHDLRHTAATVAISTGADVKSVQDLLGHSTASFTLNVYAHTSEQMMKDTAARVQGYYENLVQK